MAQDNGQPRLRPMVAALEDRSTPAAGPFGFGGLGGPHSMFAPFDLARFAERAPPFEGDFHIGAPATRADVTGDGTADRVRVSVSDGTATVTVTDGETHDQAASFAVPGTVTGTARVAAADLTGDGRAEIVAATVQDESLRVVVFDGASVGGTDAPTTLADFVVSDGTGGHLHIDLKDITGDGVADLLVGARHNLIAYDGASLAQGQQVQLTGADLPADPFPFLFGDGMGPHGPRGHGPHGPPQGAPFGDFITQDAAQTIADGLVGASFSGDGSGVLSTLSTTGDAPTTEMTPVTVAVNITNATPVVPSFAPDTAPVRSLSLTGTVTLTIGTADPVSIPFTGTLFLTSDSTDNPSGQLHLTTDRSDSGVTTTSGFTLNGTLEDGKISVEWLVASDHSSPPGGYVFLAPESRDAGPITLTHA